MSDQELQLRPRDVRMIDPSFANLEPAVLVRSGALAISFGRTELRAIITRRRLYFAVPDGADSVLRVVQDNLAQLQQPSDSATEGSDCAVDDADTPFEFAALEAMARAN